MATPSQEMILVTGASSGIGLAACKRLLEMGYRVTGMARSIAEQKIDHPGFTPLACDLTDFEQSTRLVKAIINEEGQLAGAVFCAGSGYFGGLEQLEFRRVRSLIDLNLLSPILLSKLLVPYLKQLGAGRLLYVGSEAALQGAKYGTAYCASKFGLRGFVQSLSAECRQAGVNVSLINPGMVDTPFYDKLHFKPGPDQANHIPVEAVVDCIEQILRSHPQALIEEVNLMPRNRVVTFKE